MKLTAVAATLAALAGSAAAGKAVIGVSRRVKVSMGSLLLPSFEASQQSQQPPPTAHITTNPQTQVTPFCSAIASAPKSASNCNRALGFFCDEMANCPFLADFQAQLDALQAEIASIRVRCPDCHLSPTCQ